MNMVRAAFISNGEEDLYVQLASSWRGNGLIIDAGCFVGASTVALCKGLGGRIPEFRRPIIALDRFLANDLYIVERFSELGVDVRYGESFIDIFLSNLETHIDRVEVRAGELMAVGRIERPIELLVIDIAKTPGLLAYMGQSWFPRLIPGASTLVHQDFFTPAQPWIAVAMGELLEYFEPTGVCIGESAVFRYAVKAPGDAIRRAMTTPFVSDRGLASLERVQSAFGGQSQPLIMLMKARILYQLGRANAARHELNDALSHPSQPRTEKWMKWFSIVAAQVEPSFSGARKFAWQAYMEHGHTRLGDY